MAGEHSFPTISPKGSKAPESNDLRGQVKFKLLTASEDFVFPGNYKGETLLGKTVYLIHFTAPGTNKPRGSSIKFNHVDGLLFPEQN